LNPRNLARKIIAAFPVPDIDMHNLFPTTTLLEDLQEASVGIYDENAPGACKGRNYDRPQSMPLVVRPPYTGDFLDQLRNPIQGKPIESADSNNIYDFSMPSEMLKHQENPVPRILVDDFYEMGRPGEDAGGEDLKEYWDRAWDGDAPEVSEDLIERMDNFPTLESMPKCSCEKKVASNFFRRFAHFAQKDVIVIPKIHGPQISSVIANYMLDRFPVEASFNPYRLKEAKLIRDLEKTMITTKKRGRRRPDDSNVTARLKLAEPKVGRWTFNTTSGRDTYATIFQFQPKGTEQDLKKLRVFVSCSCLSWLFWGAQYNAAMQDYLYGKVSLKFRVPKGHRPTFSDPIIRDKSHEFLVCKHVLKCLPLLLSGEEQYKIDIGFKPKRVIKPLELDKKTLPEVPEPVPGELKPFGRFPEIKAIEQRWNTMKPRDRATAIAKMDSPGWVAYLGAKFPDTAGDFVMNRLKELAHDPKSTPTSKSLARKYLRKYWLGGPVEEEEPALKNELKDIERKVEREKSKINPEEEETPEEGEVPEDGEPQEEESEEQKPVKEKPAIFKTLQKLKEKAGPDKPIFDRKKQREIAKKQRNVKWAFLDSYAKYGNTEL
jgi:hypothetical protein